MKNKMFKVFFNAIADGSLTVFGNIDFQRRDEVGTNLLLFSQSIGEDALGSLFITATSGDSFNVPGMIGVAGVTD